MKKANASKQWEAKQEKLRGIITSVRPEPFVKVRVNNIIQLVMNEGKRWLKFRWVRVMVMDW